MPSLQGGRRSKHLDFIHGAKNAGPIVGLGYREAACSVGGRLVDGAKAGPGAVLVDILLPETHPILRRPFRALGVLLEDHIVRLEGHPVSSTGTLHFSPTTCQEEGPVLPRTA